MAYRVGGQTLSRSLSDPYVCYQNKINFGSVALNTINASVQKMLQTATFQNWLNRF